MSILKNANLPKNEVNTAAISCKADLLVGSLQKSGINILRISPSSEILYGLSSHADMHLLHLGGNSVWISKNQIDNIELLKNIGFKVNVLDIDLKEKYPLDVPLNAAVFGENVILNPKTICKEIDFTGKNLISVNQGYAKCSICIANEDAIITDDTAIHASALKNNIDSLLVSKGDIILEGMNYGFIGGCCGKISKDIMLFNGRLSSHRDSQNIKSFLLNHQIHSESFGDYPLTDIGGIIPLTEK